MFKDTGIQGGDNIENIEQNNENAIQNEDPTNQEQILTSDTEAMIGSTTPEQPPINNTQSEEAQFENNDKITDPVNSNAESVTTSPNTEIVPSTPESNGNYNLSLKTPDQPLAPYELPTLTSVGIEAVTKSHDLTPTRKQAIQEELLRIEQLRTEETIVALRKSGELSDKDTENANKLIKIYRISAEGMTPEEAEKTLIWCENGEDVDNELIKSTIEREKTRLIADALTKVVDGKGNRRFDKLGSPIATNDIVTLAKKAREWLKGRIDTSLGFDIEKVGINNNGEGVEEFEFLDYDRENAKELVSRMLENPDGFSSAEKEEVFDWLVEMDFLDEGDQFIMGPFTNKDMDIIDAVCGSTYARVTDQRYSDSLAQLDVRWNTGITADLDKKFVAEKILPKRRLSARNALAAAAALGIYASKLKGTGSSNSIRLTDGLRKLSKYCIEVCDLSKSDIAAQYDRVLPISEDFYRDIIDRVEDWSDEKAKQKDIEFNSSLLKLAERMRHVEQCYHDVVDTEKKEDSTNVEKETDHNATDAEEVTDHNAGTPKKEDQLPKLPGF